MAVNTDPFPIQSTLTGSGQTINVTEYFLEDSDLEVWKTVDGVDTLLVLNTDYTVSGAGNEAGGSITMTGGESGWIITISRSVSNTQDTELTYQGQQPSSTLERGYDRIVMQVQKLAALVGRALRVPITDAAIDPLAKAASRAAKILGFDASGAPALYDQSAVVYVEGDILSVANMTALEALDASDIADGTTVQVRGYYEAGDGGGGVFELITSSATVTEVLRAVLDQSGKRWRRVITKGERINVAWFGAKCDYDTDATDDTTAIQSAIDYAATLDSSNSPAYVVVPKGSKITDTITVPVRVNLICDGVLNYTGDQDKTAVLINGDTGTELTQSVIAVNSPTLSAWTDEAYIGVKLVNLNRSHVKILQASRFTIGVQCIGDGGGFAWNEVTLGAIRENKIGVELTNDDSGYCNENLFLGGHFGHNSSTRTTLDRWAVKITSQDGAYTINNNNVFLKPSFELKDGNLSGGAEGVAVLIDYGIQNSFLYFRFEDCTRLADIDNEATENKFIVGFDTQNAASLNEIGDYTNNLLVKSRNRASDLCIYEVYDSGNIMQQAADADGGTDYNFRELDFWDSSASEPDITGEQSVSGQFFGSNWVRLPSTRAVSIRVDTSTAKTFLVNTRTTSANKGRIAVACYDSDGARLTGGDPLPVRGRSTLVPSFLASFGGVYRRGADGNDFYFTVRSDVAFIDILISGGTSDLHLYGFNIRADAMAETRVSKLKRTNLGDGPVATAEPTEGSFILGQKVVNSNAGSGEPLGWICTTAGTFGTLSSVTGGITSGQKSLVVNDADDLEVGMVITIAGVSGNKIITHISGTAITVHTAADATVAGAAVAYATPAFQAYGQAGYRSGSASPSGSVTPYFVGEEWLDSTANKWYKAYGTGNTDWAALN